MNVINTHTDTPSDEDKLGSDCSGVDGAADRTLTLAESNIHTTGLVITVNGASLHEGATKDFTVASNVITFKNNVDDTDNIRVVYFTK